MVCLIVEIVVDEMLKYNRGLKYVFCVYGVDEVRSFLVICFIEGERRLR